MFLMMFMMMHYGDCGIVQRQKSKTDLTGEYYTSATFLFFFFLNTGRIDFYFTMAVSQMLSALLIPEKTQWSLFSKVA